MPYLEFSYLTVNMPPASLPIWVMAEEATFNQAPCITLNSYTEHEENGQGGDQILVGEDAERLARSSGIWFRTTEER